MKSKNNRTTSPNNVVVKLKIDIEDPHELNHEFYSYVNPFSPRSPKSPAVFSEICSACTNPVCPGCHEVQPFIEKPSSIDFEALFMEQSEDILNEEHQEMVALRDVVSRCQSVNDGIMDEIITRLENLKNKSEDPIHILNYETLLKLIRDGETIDDIVLKFKDILADYNIAEGTFQLEELEKMIQSKSVRESTIGLRLYNIAYGIRETGDSVAILQMKELLERFQDGEHPELIGDHMYVLLSALHEEKAEFNLSKLVELMDKRQYIGSIKKQVKVVMKSYERAQKLRIVEQIHALFKNFKEENYEEVQTQVEKLNQLQHQHGVYRKMRQ